MARFIRADVAPTQVSETNYVRNPRFAASSSTGWSLVYGDAATAPTRGLPLTGGMRATWSVPQTTGDAGIMTQAAITAAAGSSWSARARVGLGGPPASRNIYVGLAWWNAGTLLSVNYSVAPIIFNSGALSDELTVGGVAPANVTHVQVFVGFKATTALPVVAGTVLYVSDVLLSNTLSPPAFFDGYTPNTLDHTYAWTGTANNSTSTHVGRTHAWANYVAPTLVTEWSGDYESPAHELRPIAAEFPIIVRTTNPVGPRTGNIRALLVGSFEADKLVQLARRYQLIYEDEHAADRSMVLHARNVRQEAVPGYALDYRWVTFDYVQTGAMPW